MTWIGVSIACGDEGITCTPDREKIQKWLHQIDSSLQTNRMCAGQASKLAGRLMWASHFTFKRLGRAFLYPIFLQQRARRSNVGRELRLSLRWWRDALATGGCEVRDWVPSDSPPLHMICDAASTPPRIAAVIFHGSQRFYSDMEPPSQARALCLALQLLSPCMRVASYSGISKSEKMDRSWASSCWPSPLVAKPWVFAFGCSYVIVVLVREASRRLRI